MSWFSCTEDYSLKEDNFYGEPEITYGSKKDDTDPETSSSSGAWDNFQHELVNIISCANNEKSR